MYFSERNNCRLTVWANVQIVPFTHKILQLYYPMPGRRPHRLSVGLVVNGVSPLAIKMIGTEDTHYLVATLESFKHVTTSFMLESTTI